MTVTGWDSDDYCPRKFESEPSFGGTANVVLVLSILTQLFNPSLIYLGMRCHVRANLAQLDKKDDAEAETLRRNHPIYLDSPRIHPDQLAYDAETLRQLEKRRDELESELSEIRERKQARRKQAESTLSVTRIFSLYYYFSIWLWIGYLMLIVKTEIFPWLVCVTLYRVSIFFVVICYILVLVEHFFSAEWQYIRNISSTVSVADHIDSIRAAQPSVTMQAHCYHYESKTTRTGTRKRASGQERYREKVTTGTYRDNFLYSYWKDTSKSELAGISGAGITKIKVTLVVNPGNEETAVAFEKWCEAFREKHKYNDVHVDYSIEHHVPGLKERLAVYGDIKHKPWWINQYMYWVAAILYLGWPYRLAFNRAVTCQTHYTVTKAVYIAGTEGEFEDLQAFVSLLPTADMDKQEA